MIGFQLGQDISTSVPARLSYTAGAYSIETSSLTAAPSLITANGLDKSTITLQLKDAHGNNVLTEVSEEVTLKSKSTTASAPGMIADNGVMKYQGNGIYTTTVSSTNTGEEVFEYTIGTIEGKATAAVKYDAGDISLIESTITVDKPSITVGSEISTVTITLLDANKNPITTSAGNTIALTGLDIGLLESELTEGDLGVYTATIHSEKIGTDTLGFTYETS